MKTKLKNQEKLSLQELLLRRKTTFESFVKEKCIVTFEDLVKECKRLDLKKPDNTFREKFQIVSEIDNSISNPKEGIIVIDVVDSKCVEDKEFVLDTLELSVDTEKHISDTLEPVEKKKKKKSGSIG